MADGTSPHEIARLRQAWDRLVATQPAALDDLDPDLAETVQHLHALYQPPAPDPRFLEQLGAELQRMDVPRAAPSSFIPSDHAARRRHHGMNIASTSVSRFSGDIHSSVRNPPDGRAWNRRKHESTASRSPRHDPPTLLPTHTNPMVLPQADDARFPNIAPRPTTGTARRRGWGSVATVALLLLTVIASVVAFGPGLSWRLDELPAILPTDSGTPATPAVTTETLLDATITRLPPGRNMVAVDRWRLQPSPKEVILPVHEGMVLMTVDVGEITVNVAGSDHRLEPGKALDVANHEFAFHASGTEEAIGYAVYVTPSFPGYGANRFWLSGDPLLHSSDAVMSSSVDALPGGPARVVLERLTLPPGSALPLQKADPLVWTEVGSGDLGLTLEGERLPYGWKAGIERKYFHFGREILPRPSPGTTMQMRNAGDDPLVLYRLTLLPNEAGTPGATPTS